jgi:hypothetical protein
MGLFGLFVTIDTALWLALYFQHEKRGRFFVRSGNLPDREKEIFWGV